MVDLEIWKTIDGSDGRYEVSNLGRVKRVDHFKQIIRPTNSHLRHYPERILKLSPNKKGYKHIRLETGKNWKRLCRVILHTFDPRDNEDELIADHINGVRHDDRLENLRWVSPQMNTSNIPYTRYLQELLEENRIPFLSTEEYFK